MAVSEACLFLMDGSELIIGTNGGIVIKTERV